MTDSDPASVPSDRQALLLVAHKLTISLLEKYWKLQTAFASYGDVFLVRQAETHEGGYLLDVRDDIKEVVFSTDDLAQLPYKAIESSIIPGSNHFILLWFFRNHPEYTHYWNIEYDVEYNGDWTELFDSFSESDSDFLSTHIRSFKDEPQWYWWTAFFTKNEYIPVRERLASFNPIYRISSVALLHLNDLLSEGWAGHHEVFIPTVLSRCGFKLEDFGGKGEYVKHSNLNRFYDSAIPEPLGTMRHKPPFNAPDIDRKRNLLYHPVKI